ncbi:MAG: hypothetical protein K2X94_01475 [Amoebophilaceae bacterium]|nr:hypothetical protein [Amoebophilaceae bacterium]
MLILVGLIGCKDFKNWQSVYGSKINVTFKPVMDGLVPAVVKDLRSVKLNQMIFYKRIGGGSWENISSLNPAKSIEIPLKPGENEVSVEIQGQSGYYHKVTIHYKSTLSLISPEAGGLQQKYILTHVVLSTQPDKQPIFKSHEIESAIPLKTKEAEKTTHVTIYY